MSVPAQPTETSIVTQAYKDFGIAQPTSAQISRAISDGIEWVKRELTELGAQWKFMMKYTYIITKAGVNNYAVPTDYLKFISCRIGEGTITGTAQAGSISTITLASNSTVAESTIQGKYLVITGGSAVGQGAQIANYNASTKVVTFDQSLTVATDSTSTYLIVDTFSPVTDQIVTDLRSQSLPSLSGKPYILVHVPDSLEGRVMFNLTPDKVYVVELRYYGDLLKEDTTSARYATTFLRLAAGVLTKGVTCWLASDDDRLTYFENKYSMSKRNFSNRQLYGADLSGMQMTTGEE